MSHTTTRSVYVWDITIRLFHWATVAGIGFLWYSGETGGNIMHWHMYAGYGLLTLLLYRLMWGVVGSRYARFRDFLTSPKQTVQYLPSVFSRQPEQHLSHNPLGGWMVIVLLILMLIQVISGLFTTDDIFTEGPLFAVVDDTLGYWLTSVHKFNFNLLLGAIALHILAVLFHAIVKKEPLIKAMLTGHKPESGSARSPSSQPNYAVALSCVALSVLCVYAVVNLPAWL